MGVCNCSMFCCTLLYVHFSIAIILMGKRELIALLNLSSWCLVMVERLFLTVPRGFLQFVIVVFPDHTHLLFLLPKYTLLRTYLNRHSQRRLNKSVHPWRQCRKFMWWLVVNYHTVLNTINAYKSSLDAYFHLNSVN